MKRLKDTLLAILREIFDEAAYSRHLAGSAPDKVSYARFIRERASRSERRPRCC